MREEVEKEWLQKVEDVVCSKCYRRGCWTVSGEDDQHPGFEIVYYTCKCGHESWRYKSDMCKHKIYRSLCPTCSDLR